MMRGLMMELKAENISFSYHKKKPILKDVSLSLNSNQIIGLIGDSGSGKSTLCKIISGYISNYTGEVTIDGNSAIQPSHPLSSPSPPAPNPSQHQSLFQ